MKKSNKVVTIAEGKIVNKIYFIRGKKVMFDFDLAELYGVETKYLKRQVKRNIERFPSDFMFILSKKEFENLRCQFGTSSWGGSRHIPMAFTEQGVTMLSNALNSSRAIMVSIRIVRVFTKMKEMMLTHQEILNKLDKLEKKLKNQDSKLKDYEQDIQLIFDALKKLINPQDQDVRRRIGFKQYD
jgi:phage regulator Rha-like protein